MQKHPEEVSSPPPDAEGISEDAPVGTAPLTTLDFDSIEDTELHPPVEHKRMIRPIDWLILLGLALLAVLVLLPLL